MTENVTLLVLAVTSAIFRLLGLATIPKETDPKFFENLVQWYRAVKKREQPLYAKFFTDLSLLLAYIVVLFYLLKKIYP